MNVAVVGSRRGADLAHVRQFVRALHEQQPDTILVSGGADGVDKAAEQLWIELGGRVLSYRPRQKGGGNQDIYFAIELWKLGSWETPGIQELNEEPTWADYPSAALYRDSLIAADADKVVAFFSNRRTDGTQVTLDFAAAYDRDSYEYFNHAK